MSTLLLGYLTIYYGYRGNFLSEDFFTTPYSALSQEDRAKLPELDDEMKVSIIILYSDIIQQQKGQFNHFQDLHEIIHNKLMVVAFSQLVLVLLLLVATLNKPLLRTRKKKPLTEE